MMLTRVLAFAMWVSLIATSLSANVAMTQEAGLYVFTNPHFACSYEEEEDGLNPYIVKIDPTTQEILRYYYPPTKFIRPRRENLTYYRALYQQTGRAVYQRRAQNMATLLRQGNLCKQGLIQDDEDVTPPGDDSPPSNDAQPCDVLGTSTDGVTARIINGTSCTVGDSPIVKLQVFFGGDQYRCTGNVIAPRVVLTASHCIASGSDRATAVDAVTGNGTVSAVGYAIHPDNSTGAPGPNDLAILTFDEDLPTRVLGVVTSSSDYTIGETAIIAGYGRVGTGIGGNTTSDTLMAGKMRINEVSSEEIISLFDHYTDGVEWSNTCNGDSGGPLVVERESEWVLAGITSYGYAEDCGPTDTSGFVNLQSSTNRQFIATYAPDAIQ